VTDVATAPESPLPAAPPPEPPGAARSRTWADAIAVMRRALGWVTLALAVAALGWAYQLQQRLRQAEESFARREQQALQQIVEARTLARQAESTARDMAAKIALLEARVGESALQRTQLEDLMQALTRSRDENVLFDIDAALRVAQQQAALTGSVEPLVSALRQTEERLSRTRQPRLERVRRAALEDLDRVRAAGSVDVTTLTLRLDEVARQIDDLPLVSAHGPSAAREAPAAPARRAASSAGDDAVPGASWVDGMRQLAGVVWAEARQLVRVTRIAYPEAALLAPDQALFLRENLRLRLLNARLSLLSRQFDAAQSDLRQAQALLDKYFDRTSRRVVAASELLRQLTTQSRAVTAPRPDSTLSAIAAVTGGTR